MTAWSNREERKASEGNQSASSKYDSQRVAGGFEELEDEAVEDQKMNERLNDA